MYLLERNENGNLKLVAGVSDYSGNSSFKPIITDGVGKLNPSLFSPLTFTGRYIEYQDINTNDNIQLTVDSPTTNYVTVGNSIILSLPPASECEGRIFTIVNISTGSNKSIVTPVRSVDNQFYLTVQSVNNIWRELCYNSIVPERSQIVTVFPTLLDNDSPYINYLSSNQDGDYIDLSINVREGKKFSLTNTGSYPIELKVNTVSTLVFLDPRGVVDCIYSQNDWNIYLKY